MIRTNDRLKRLVIDIETSAHLARVWGLFNQNVGLSQIEDPTRMLSFAAQWMDNPRVVFFSEFHHGKKKMVKAAFDLVNEADAVIHFNGKGFDMKHLNREFQEVLPGLGLHPRPSDYHHIDMLSVVRKHFKLASNKLDYVAKWLGIGQKVKHPGMDLWNECMAGNPKAWNLMRRYNKWDVSLTGEVYTRLLPWIDGHPNMQLYTGEQASCPKCGSDRLQSRGTRKTLLGEYPRYQCQSCGSWSSSGKSVFRADER